MLQLLLGFAQVLHMACNPGMSNEFVIHFEVPKHGLFLISHIYGNRSRVIKSTLCRQRSRSEVEQS